jgi:hypothetical protein
VSFGFGLFVVCGRIASIRAGLQNGSPVTDVMVLSKNSRKAGGKRDALLAEATFYGKYASVFNKSGFRQGDKIAVSLSSISHTLWTDANGFCRAALNGPADKFWDLRSGGLSEEREFEAQIRGLQESGPAMRGGEGGPAPLGGDGSADSFADGEGEPEGGSLKPRP